MFYWYRSAASHNTVIIDGKEHGDICCSQRDLNGGQGYIFQTGKTAMLSDGEWIKAVSAGNAVIWGPAWKFEWDA